jgi:hypothetical protein
MGTQGSEAHGGGVATEAWGKMAPESAAQQNNALCSGLGPPHCLELRRQWAYSRQYVCAPEGREGEEAAQMLLKGQMA